MVKTVAQTEATRRWRLKNPDKVLAMRRRYALKHREEIRERDRKYRSEHPDRRRKTNRISYFKYREERRRSQNEYSKTYCQTYRKIYPEKYRAHRLVTDAIGRGELVRQNCWCGKEGQAHHEDYAKPYQVVWLCRKHHAECHRKYEKINHGRPRG